MGEGWLGAYYNENDPEKAAWLRELIAQNVVAPGEVDERSIAEVRPGDLRGFKQCHFFAGVGCWSYALRLAGWPDDRPCWTGSCPCPSFSCAGKGEGFDDPRHLWPVWYPIICECRPGVVFGEQADAAIGHGWLDLVSTDMEAQEYAFASAVLGAHSVGAPHIRQRLWFVANAHRDRFSKKVARHSAHDSKRNVAAHKQGWNAVGYPAGASIEPSWQKGFGGISHIPRMDDGITYGMGISRGFGDAIVPQVAEAFIRAYIEAKCLTVERV